MATQGTSKNGIIFMVSEDGDEHGKRPKVKPVTPTGG